MYIDDGQPSAELPDESDYFSNEESSVSMVPSSNESYLTRNIFTDDHRKYLLEVCSSMVKSGIISQSVVKDLLSNDEEGKKLLPEFTIKPLINRLKYERRLWRDYSNQGHLTKFSTNLGIKILEARNNFSANYP